MAVGPGIGWAGAMSVATLAGGGAVVVAALAAPGCMDGVWRSASPVWPRVGGGGLAAGGLTGALIQADELLDPVVEGAFCGLGRGVRVGAKGGDAWRVVAP